jgi:hypothetical protein
MTIFRSIQPFSDDRCGSCHQMIRKTAVELFLNMFNTEYHRALVYCHMVMHCHSRAASLLIIQNGPHSNSTESFCQDQGLAQKQRPTKRSPGLARCYEWHIYRLFFLYFFIRKLISLYILFTSSQLIVSHLNMLCHNVNIIGNWHCWRCCLVL